jgi:hypothetical protein
MKRFLIWGRIKRRLNVLNINIAKIDFAMGDADLNRKFQMLRSRNEFIKERSILEGLIR